MSKELEQLLEKLELKVLVAKLWRQEVIAILKGEDSGEV